jgi:hypothetical protein
MRGLGSPVGWHGPQAGGHEPTSRKRSGANDTAAIIKVRQQRIVEMTGYLDRHEALRAAGLEV